MLKESMLLQHSLAIAHLPVMPLNKDTTAPRGHYTRGRKRPRADGQNLNGLSASRITTEKRTHFLENQRGPVGRNKCSVHPMRCCSRAHRRSPPVIHSSHPIKTCSALKAAPWLGLPAKGTSLRSSHRYRTSSACSSHWLRKAEVSVCPARRRACNARRD